MKRLRMRATAEALPTLFNFDETPAEAATTPVPATAAPVREPDIFETILSRIGTFTAVRDIAGLIRATGSWDKICFTWHQKFTVPSFGSIFPAYSNNGYGYEPQNITWFSPVWHENGDGDRNIEMDIVAVGNDGTPKTLSLRIAYTIHDNVLECGKVTVGRWMSLKKASRLPLFLQTETEIRNILTAARPWILPWADQKGYDIRRYCAAPWMETLEKAGYDFARWFLQHANNHAYDSADMDRINRLVQPGTKPSNIFKADKCVYTNLKDCTNMQTWDVYRRMVKGDKLNQDTVRQALDRGFNDRDLEKVSSILGIEYGGRKVFTWNSLMNYLGRIDMYEAIPSREGLDLLYDYLHMCVQLDMAPRIDGDSLKREHDIAARLVRERRNEEAQRRMEENARRVREAMPFLEYHEDNFFIRPITDYDDLIDEATQQHNCVASYAGRIAAGQTIVLTMRETRSPQQSLITVELSPDCRQIRQKLLACNRPIHSRSQSEFLDRWHRRVKGILAEGSAQQAATTAAAA